jgi:uncharacterized protein (TIGR00725 family)
MSRRLLLGVIGDAVVPQGDVRYDLAREVGRLAIDAGYRVVCGGLGGVMEAACRGAHESKQYREGDTIGLLPDLDPARANQWVDVPIATGLGHLRNGLVANSDAIVAIGGGAGTMAELAFAWMYRRPIVALAVQGWSGRLGGVAIDERRQGNHCAGTTVIQAHTAEQALAAIAAHVRVATAC